MRIICVDDHPVMLKGLLLEVQQVMPKADTVGFSDGKSAVSFAKQYGCDVLFCEIALHPNDGIDLAKAIKRLNPKVNIIFTTVCSEKEYAKKVLRLRTSGYLTKPVTTEQVRQELLHLRYPVADPQEPSADQPELSKEQLSTAAGGLLSAKDALSRFQIGQSVSVTAGTGFSFGKINRLPRTGVILGIKPSPFYRRWFTGKQSEYVYTVQYSDGSIQSAVPEHAISDDETLS